MSTEYSSSTGSDRGKLILAGNAIGNPTDIPVRALEALRAADLVIFEEDRPARAALKAAGIHRSYLKLNEHDSKETLALARTALKARQTILYMSDQGMPNVADPGRDLTSIARELGAALVVIPGPSSITSALAAFPESYDQFHYAGFLAREPARRDAQLRQFLGMPMPVVILDAPYRLNALLDSLANSASSQRRIFLALDVSGSHETYLYDFPAAVRQQCEELPAKLNFVLILAAR